MAVKHKRWYDKNRRLAKQLDALMKVESRDEYRVIKGLMELIRASDPSILTRFVIPSDIEAWHRRWYDKDPVYWIALNGLRHAQECLLEDVACYLEKALARKPRARRPATAARRNRAAQR